jgi:hypothetical protein
VTCTLRKANPPGKIATIEVPTAFNRSNAPSRRASHSFVRFPILARKLRERASFAAKEGFKAKIEAFIAYFNETLAKPFE